MVNIHTDLSSRTGTTLAIQDLIKLMLEVRDGTGDVVGSIGYLQKQINELSLMISGLSAGLEGLQRLGLHDQSVTIMMPASGATIKDTITVSGTYYDQSGHTMISGRLLVSGVFVTGCVFPASGYWNSTLDTTKFDNGLIQVQAELFCVVGTSKRSSGIIYTVKNQIAAGGTSQQGTPGTYGDKVGLTLSSPGQAIFSFTINGSFSSTQGHAISSVQAWSNTSKVSVGSPTWSGYGISIPCYVGDWGGVQYAIITCRVTDVAGCQVEASTRVYAPLGSLPGA